MDYSVALLFLLGLVLSFYCIGLVYQENEGLSLITISVSVYFTLFVIISGFFFWADRFQMDAVLLTVAIVFLLSCIGMVVIRRKYEFSLHWTKRSPIILLVIFVGFLISFIKFDFFGMGQDQGVYQVKAIALAHGETSQQLAFDEIDKLPTEELRTEATEAVKSCTGFYFF